MLYTSLAQPIIFLYLFLGGMACGFLFDAANLLTYLCNKNKVAKHIFGFVATALCFCVYFLINMGVNYGQIRFFAVLAFCLAIFVQRILISKFFGKMIKKCYNFFHGRRKKEKNS